MVTYVTLGIFNHGGKPGSGLSHPTDPNLVSRFAVVGLHTVQKYGCYIRYCCAVCRTAPCGVCYFKFFSL